MVTDLQQEQIRAIAIMRTAGELKKMVSELTLAGILMDFLYDHDMRQAQKKAFEAATLNARKLNQSDTPSLLH